MPAEHSPTKQTMANHLPTGETVESIRQQYTDLCQSSIVVTTIRELTKAIRTAQPGQVISYVGKHEEYDRKIDLLMHCLKNSSQYPGLKFGPEVSSVSVVDDEIQVPYLLGEVGSGYLSEKKQIAVLWRQKIDQDQA